MTDHSTKFTSKPWGYEILWALTDKYAGKILHIHRGHRLSLQLHEKKEETIYVIKGCLLLHLGSGKEAKTITLNVGESHHIKPNTIHRMEAYGSDVDVVEVSTPELNDVVRLEDDYGRTKN